jgi:hypothetical protein
LKTTTKTTTTKTNTHTHACTLARTHTHTHTHTQQQQQHSQFRKSLENITEIPDISNTHLQGLNVTDKPTHHICDYPTRVTETCCEIKSWNQSNKC